MKKNTNASSFPRITSGIFPAGLFVQQQKPDVNSFLVDDTGWQDMSVPFWHRENKVRGQTKYRSAINFNYNNNDLERNS